MKGLSKKGFEIVVKLYYSTDPETLFNEALTLQEIPNGYYDFSGIIYITPSSLRAKNALKIFHRVIQGLSTDKTSSCYIPPEITTIPELSKRLNSTYGTKTLLPDSMIPILVSRLSGKGMGLSVLISGLIRDLKQFHPDRGMEELKEQIITTLDELNIPDSLKKSITLNLEIFRLYQESLAMNNLVDTNDLLTLCPDYIRKYISFGTAIIDGFYSPTKAEMLIIKAIIERSGHSLISIPRVDGLDELTRDYVDFLKENFELNEIIESFGQIGKPQNFKYHPYDDIETEVEGIARHIKSLFIAGKIKDLSYVVVAFPSLDKYKEITERVFNRYGIPFNVTHKKSLGQTSPFIDLLCMIQSVCEDYPRLKFSQLLSSRYFKGIPDSLKAWIPALSLQSGIISGKKAWLDFLLTGNERLSIKRVINNLFPDPDNRTLFGESDPFSMESIKDIERDLRYVFDRLRPLDEIKASATLSTFSKTIKAILQDLRFLEASPADEEYRAYIDIKKHLWDCLDELSFLEEVKPSRLNLQEFMEYLWHILNNTYMETDIEGVTVTDIQGAFFIPFKKYIYIGGMTDEDMPGRDVDYILPDIVKREIGLPDLDKKIMLQKFLLENIMKSLGDIHLSYPLSEGENRFLPSPFIYSYQSEKERIPGLFSKEELFATKAEIPLSELLLEVKIRPEMLNKGMLNVTDIDAYRNCPRKCFIERVLNLLPSTIKEYDLEATALGEIIHRVMERIIFEPLDDIDRLRKRAVVIVEEVTESKNIDNFWKAIIRDTFVEILPEIISKEMEIRKDGYKPFKVEEKITGEPIKGIRLKGKIDRIDKSERGMAIIDYKTGSDTLTCSKVLTGREKLQLFLYAALLKTAGYNVDRVGVYSLKDITVKWCPSKRKGNNITGMDEMITASLKFLEETVKEMRKGIFTARPLDDNYFLCRRCHENPLCPYIQS